MTEQETTTATETVVSYYSTTSVGRAFLGQERCEAGMQLFLPDFTPDGVAITITKIFGSIETHRWKVIGLSSDPSGLRWEVDLEPRTDCVNEEFLAQTRWFKRPGTIQARPITVGTLVEVDFGHVTSVLKEGQKKSNKRYPDTIQRWEMHKRRLCIVIKHVKDRLFVVPLSSKEPDSPINTIFELDPGDIRGLLNYQDPCFALVHMMQPISARRVLPPLGYDKSSPSPKRNLSYIHRLGHHNIKKLENALMCSIGKASTLIEVRNYKRSISKLQEERDDLESLSSIYKKVCLETIMEAYNVDETAAEDHLNSKIEAHTD
ncbi:type II toxin-antitoxin system PemK/MazF family toxin [Roseibium aggregatum]|uniref:type II toxin-antitoxin system PemK/MazF family toxin n=1 Tax=Roseibium aggregatum TaxID=187304 RepID=UPI0025AD873F|nr:type II toxin-antitoxin system PemK/MazF family toxin [Roseibium aggregatum]WJS00337.1 type II toxin-antitoxin system PemK/MazF family toxin [Roseibium aggregatum]